MWNEPRKVTARLVESARNIHPYNIMVKQSLKLLCGRDTVLVRAQRPAELEELAKRLKEIGRVKANDFLLSVEYQTYRVVFFKDGRTLVHGTDSIEKAKSIYYHLAG